MMTTVTEPKATPPVTFKGLLTPEEIRHYRYPVLWRAVVDMSLVWVQILAAVGLYVGWPNPLSFVTALVLIAGGQHGLYLVAHEFAHFAVLPRHRRLNDFFGTWFFAAPIGMPLKLFRFRHFTHHRLYSTVDDTKDTYRRDIHGYRLWLEMVKSLTAYDYLRHGFRVLEHSRQPSNRRQGVLPRGSLLPLVVAQLVLLGAFWTINPWLYLGLWILPLVTLTEMFGKIRALMEHQPRDCQSGAAPGSGYFRDTPGPFVRSVKANWFERLFLSKINFGYHAEHHLWPQLSYQYLPRVHRRLLERGAFDDPRLGNEKTYLSTIRHLSQHEPPQQSASSIASIHAADDAVEATDDAVKPNRPASQCADTPVAGD